MEKLESVKKQLADILATSGYSIKFLHNLLKDMDETDYNSCPSCGSDEIVIDYYNETMDELHCNKCGSSFCQTKVLTSFEMF